MYLKIFYYAYLKSGIETGQHKYYIIWVFLSYTWKRNAKKQMAIWGGLTNSCEKERSKKQRRKGNIKTSVCRVQEQQGEIRKPFGDNAKK